MEAGRRETRVRCRRSSLRLERQDVLAVDLHTPVAELLPGKELAREHPARRRARQESNRVLSAPIAERETILSHRAEG